MGGRPFHCRQPKPVNGSLFWVSIVGDSLRPTQQLPTLSSLKPKMWPNIIVAPPTITSPHPHFEVRGLPTHIQVSLSSYSSQPSPTTPHTQWSPPLSSLPGRSKDRTRRHRYRGRSRDRTRHHHYRGRNMTETDDTIFSPHLPCDMAGARRWRLGSAQPPRWRPSLETASPARPPRGGPHPHQQGGLLLPHALLLRGSTLRRRSIRLWGEPLAPDSRAREVGETRRLPDLL
jgi:hypothetical protein